VVDDDQVQCTLICCTLDPAAYTITLAYDKQQALALCDTQYFDFAILDYELPDGSGADIAQALRRTYNIPFAFITMIDDRQRARRPIELGALGYMIKPITPKQLVIAIETACAEIEHRRNLKKAVDVHGTIGLALGIIMNQACLSKNEGLAQLRKFCQPRNLSLLFVAEHIVAAHDIFSHQKQQKPFNLAKVLEALS